MVLGEFGIEAPEKCKTCPRVGSLIATLSTAQESKGFLATASDKEVMEASARAQLAEQAKIRYPGVTEEQLTTLVDNSVAAYFDSESYTNFLKQTGTLLEIEDNTIATTLTELGIQIGSCPPEGCGSV